ncbi:nuclear segregation protein bfr1 [Anaeramoeba flamelloides]|uniref:Nuclear segregation protein bfr1 n=1 Tax=Anaeramoeba flamelloides TaxID=1746091 RepID=A0AAV7ZBK8_9EUKA|nr:nuclear segregation protein bfr1 [Anaeramoeba flamelloides]
MRKRKNQIKQKEKLRRIQEEREKIQEEKRKEKLEKSKEKEGERVIKSEIQKPKNKKQKTTQMGGETPTRKRILEIQMEIKKLQKPENKNGTKILKQMNELTKKIDSIYYNKIRIQNNQKHKLFRQKDQLFLEKNRIFEKFSNIKEQIQKSTNELGALRVEISKQKIALKKKSFDYFNLKTEIKYSTKEEIDQEVERLQQLFETSSLSRKKEKALLSQIVRRKRSKNKLGTLHQLQSNVEKEKEKIEINWEKIHEKQKQRDQYFNTKREISEELDINFEKIQKNKEQIFEIKKKMSVDYQEISVLKKEFSKLRFEEEKKYNEFCDWEKQIRMLKQKIYQLEKKEHQLEFQKRKKERENFEAQLIPWLDEINICDKLIKMLKELLPKGNKVSNKKKIKGASKTGQLEKRFQKEKFVLQKTKKKNDIEDEFVILKDKKQTKKSQGKKKGKKSMNKQNLKENTEKFKISFSFLQDFEKIMVEQPRSFEQIPELLKKLSLRKQYYHQLPLKSVPTKSNVIVKSNEKNDKKMVNLAITFKQKELAKVTINYLQSNVEKIRHKKKVSKKNQIQNKKGKVQKNNSPRKKLNKGSQKINTNKPNKKSLEDNKEFPALLFQKNNHKNQAKHNKKKMKILKIKKKNQSNKRRIKFKNSENVH